MTHPNSTLVLRRASERLSAGAAALAVTVLMLLTVSVRASEPEAAPSSVAVHYSATAFSTTAGAANVYRKLKFAAREVCGLSFGVTPVFKRRVAAEACFKSALQDAVRRLDRPMLTSLHAAATRDLG
ncbi:MAG: UrcA family protein [Pseudomonadota bacterium]